MRRHFRRPFVSKPTDQKFRETYVGVRTSGVSSGDGFSTSENTYFDLALRNRYFRYEAESDDSSIVEKRKSSSIYNL